MLPCRLCGRPVVSSDCHWRVPHAARGIFMDGQKHIRQHARPSALVAHHINKRAARKYSEWGRNQHLVINASGSLSSQCICGQACTCTSRLQLPEALLTQMGHAGAELLRYRLSHAQWSDAAPIQCLIYEFATNKAVCNDTGLESSSYSGMQQL